MKKLFLLIYIGLFFIQNSALGETNIKGGIIYIHISDDTICEGGVVDFSTGTSGGLNPYDVYSWNWSSTPSITFFPSSTIDNTSAIFLTSGQYVIQLWSNTVEGVRVTWKTITVLPKPSVTISLPLDSVSNISPFILSGGNPSGGIYSGTGVVNDSLYPTLADYPYIGIIYRYTDSYGCQSTGMDSIFHKGTVGISEPDKKDTYSVFPNPTNGIISINSSSNTNKKLLVHNNLGEIVLIQDFRSNFSTEINEPPGIYFYRIEEENNPPTTGKIILTR
jgi:hypothetical protein